MAHEWKFEDDPVDDLYQAAVAIEQGGYDFYEHLRSEHADPRVVKELEHLRDEEARHKETFRSLLGAGRDSHAALPPRLQALVQAEFVDPLNKLFQSPRITTIYESIACGLELERKSISFYQALARRVGQEKRADVDRILAEERRHLEQLAIMRAYL